MIRVGVYVISRYLRMLLLVSLFVIAMVLIADFIGMNNFFAPYNATTGAVVSFVLLNAIENFTSLLPLVILLASLFAFLSLSQRSELIAIRNIGIPATHMVTIVVLISMAIGLLYATIANPPITTSRILAEHQKDTIQGRSRNISQVAGNGIWLRENYDGEARTIHFGRVNLRTNTARDVEIFITTTRGDRRLLQAESAQINKDGDWVLRNVKAIDFDDISNIETQDMRVLSSDQSFASLFSPLTKPRHIDNFHMRAHLQQLENDGYNTVAARAYFYRNIASPLSFGVMCIIGSVFALAPFRGRNVVVRALTALGAGFAIYTVDSFVVSLGRAEYLPLWLSTVAMPIIGVTLGYILLLSLEDG